jgi:hypothetical protein
VWHRWVNPFVARHYAAIIRFNVDPHRPLIPATPYSVPTMWSGDDPMGWRLRVMTIIARSILMALIVVAGASIVRNVTATLVAATGLCHAGIAHLL